MANKKLSQTEKIDMLKYNISRYDHYFASVNFKSSFLVIGNITILGFVLSNKDKLVQLMGGYIFYVLILLITLSLITVLLAIKPYLKKYNGKDSVIFFNDIANMSSSAYQEKIRNLSELEYLKDLKEQSFILSKGLTRKFLYLNVATTGFIFTITIFFVCFGFCIDIGGAKWIRL